MLRVELGLRPGEILALRWDRVHRDHVIIDAITQRSYTGELRVGATKTKSSRFLAVSGSGPSPTRGKSRGTYSQY